MGVDLHAFALVRTLTAGDAPRTPPACTAIWAAWPTSPSPSGSSCTFTRPLSSSLEGDAPWTPWPSRHEVRLSIDYYMAQPGALAVSEMVLSGPGCQREDLVRELETVVGLPVIVATPLGTLDGAALGADEDPVRHTVSAGLAMGAAA